jgi:hypothetical protein
MVIQTVRVTMVTADNTNNNTYHLCVWQARLSTSRFIAQQDEKSGDKKMRVSDCFHPVQNKEGCCPLHRMESLCLDAEEVLGHDGGQLQSLDSLTTERTQVADRVDFHPSEHCPMSVPPLFAVAPFLGDELQSFLDWGVVAEVGERV